MTKRFYLKCCFIGILVAFLLFIIVDGTSGNCEDGIKVYFKGMVMTLPKDYQLINTLSEKGIVYSNGRCQLEIYRQPLGIEVSKASYINYSNLFLENTLNHQKEMEKETIVNHRRVHILQWQREFLTKIDNDYPCYVCVDIDCGTDIYTLMFKSREPMMESEYMGIVKSFALKQNNQRIVKQISAQQLVQGNQPTIAQNYWNEKTHEIYERYFSRYSSLVWGIFEPMALENFGNLLALEEKVAYQFPFVVYYNHFSADCKQALIGDALINAKNNGRIVELTLQTTDSESNMVYDILNGKYDDFLETYIKEIKRAGTTVLMRFCNEMNGDWCAYSGYHTSRDPEIYRKLYQYVYHKFETMGALEYTIWVWNPNEKSFPDFTWNDEVMYYPGNDYVDIVGLTGYNTGNYYQGETWRSFTEIYTPLYQKALNYHKPLMITEFVSSSIGGDKTQWIREMFAEIAQYKQIKIAIWWSGCDFDENGQVARAYWLDEDDELIKLFKENLQQYDENSHKKLDK